jgi:hypothetical protein
MQSTIANAYDELINLMFEEGTLDQSVRLDIQNMSSVEKRLHIATILDNGLGLFSRIGEIMHLSKPEYIREVIKLLKGYVLKAEVEKKKFGEVMTPLTLVKEMLQTLPEETWSNPHLKINDPANGTGPYPIMVIYKLMNGLKDWEPDDEKRYKHIVENMIYVCELQPKNMFLYMCAVDPFDKYKLNIYTGSFLESGFDKHMKDVWGVERFQVIIANPPYMKSLHIDFLNKSVDLSDKVIFIHPSPWLFRGESIAKNKNNRIKSIKLINGNYYFKNAEFGAPLTITCIEENNSEKIDLYYDTTNNQYVVDELPTGFWEPNNMMISIFNKFKLLSKDKNLSQLLFKNDGSDLIISTPRICGHAVNRSDKSKFVTNDFYTLFYKNSNLSDKNTTNKVFKVNSSEERERLIIFMKSKICRFGLYLNKVSQDSHINKYLSLIPIPSLDKNYSESEICEMFNITDEEWQFINNQIPDYYI